MWRSKFLAVHVDNEQLSYRLALAREALEEMEWAHVSLEAERSCPCCCNQETEGHLPDCRLMLALYRTRLP